MKRSVMEVSGAVITRDKNAVWVDAAGHRIAIFSRDVSHVFHASTKEILYSSHAEDLPERWVRWRIAVRRWHAVEVPDEFRPDA